MIPKFRITNTQ